MVRKRSQELIDELAQRRLIEQALREANDYLENLLNSANGPIIVWDPQFRITRFNHAFEVLTGRSETEVLGQSPAVLFPPSLVEPSMSLIHSTLTGERWNTLDLTRYLDSLTKLVVQNFWSRHHPSMTVNFTGQPLPVTLDVASPCGLVINELLSNTYKHAFPDHREGVITIQVRRDGPQHILLEYADNGVGLPPGFDPRQQQTLGFQSLFAIVELQLSGEVRIIPDHGLGFVLRIATGNYQERV